MPLKVTQNLQQATESYIAYYFYTPPEISELIPNRGPNTGGTFVYIKGKMLHPFKNSNPDFYNTTFVSFGKDIIIRVKLINNTHASIVTPPTSGEGPRAVEV
jgi:IPT/TIG domain.